MKSNSHGQQRSQDKNKRVCSFGYPSLRKIRVYYKKQILDAIEKQLAHEPDTITRNRKLLENLVPPWQMVSPIWELRVGEYRVFYDISPTESVVYVRAVRRKPRGTKTEDIS